MRKVILLGLFLFTAFLGIGQSTTPEDFIDKFPLPEDPNAEYYGSRIQRTMSLLETSNISRRNGVKILFYGQSIVQGMNAESIIENLRHRYPEAEIEFENRAIGGFQAPNLVRTAVHDLYPFYPDLLIFHVYGGEETGELERILYNVRKYTTSEILIFNHQVAWMEDPEDLVERTIMDDISSDYTDFLALKYGCELVDMRGDWKAFLDFHPDIGINTLMGDTIHTNVHPNRYGKALMQAIIEKHLQYHPAAQYLGASGWYDQVRNFEMRRYFEDSDDEILVHLDFTGNKIELYADTSINGSFSGLEVLIDGQKPSAIQDLYYATLPTKSLDHWMPALKRVSLGTGLRPEKWRLVISAINHQEKYLEYEVYGSETDYDGSGNSLEAFVSSSGQIKIEPTDFMIFWTDEHKSVFTPVGFEVSWEVKPLFTDRIHYQADKSCYLLAQGLKNGKHRLTLIQDGKEESFPIRYLRVYHPPLRD